MARILVIDDDELVRETLEIVLHDAGHDVSLAENGRVGLALLERLPQDLVICDLFMPEMEGLETMGHIREHHGDLKIIAISGGSRVAAQQSYLEDAEILGADASLSKPFQNSELLALIEHLLG